VTTSVGALASSPHAYVVDGVPRRAVDIRRGWHVRWPDGRWRLVECAIPSHSTMIIVFTDDMLSPVSYVGDSSCLTRTPAEQITAVWLEERRRAREIRRAWRDRRLGEMVTVIWGAGAEAVT
jgi:hypothetical protein